MSTPNFEIRGFNHLALVCKDMERTVDFYTNVLGMPLIKTLDLPDGIGQHFFFDIGNGNSLAFFWFAEAPDGVPGISAPVDDAGLRRMDQRCRLDEPRRLRRPAEKFEDYRQRLKARAYGSARS